MPERVSNDSPCHPSLNQLPLLDEEQASALEAMFKVLANRTRLRLLHALVREPGLCVSELSARVGMKPQAVSNQLQRLADRGIVASRRRGTQVHYTVSDCCTPPLLSYGLCLSRDGAGGGQPLTGDRSFPLPREPYP